MKLTGGVYRTKGSHLIQAEAWTDERLGAGAFKKLLGEVTGEPVGLLLPGAWYDVEPFNRCSTRSRRTSGSRSKTSRWAWLARTRCRIFLRFATPHRVLSQTPRLWSTYVAFGDAQAILNEPGHYIGEGTGIPPHLLDWVCGAWRGFIPAAVEVAGGKEVVGRIILRDRGSDGEARLRLDVHYRT
jgi:hypothetical protein